ncbi:MAG: hypothetical protein WA997_11645 [Anaerolineales bacterium]|jgi:hypothetical protein|nr:hypothetical protein [Anaerolineales bacterium]HUV27083.1 hypothetical protein [Anaerolineales bacterium]
MRRWIWFLLLVILGVGLGLLYGWVINPVKYVDTTPAKLRSDYQTDYILMVAEAYQAEGDLDLAARRLAVLGDSHPAEIVRQGMILAAQINYADSDQELLSQLASELQTWIPSPGGVQP